MMTLCLVCPGRCRLGRCSQVNIHTASLFFIDTGPWQAPAVCVSSYLPNGHGQLQHAHHTLVSCHSAPRRA